jgi:hypothetical protein
VSRLVRQDDISPTTPEEIVRYQVERVDAVLRSELGLADGLADPKVVVLDPCCGTGAYLRAVLRRIASTLHDKGGDALVTNDLKKAAMERVFGFEILPAPFVIAHLQLGLELETLGAPLSDRGDPPERAGVYLTNAFTGWEPPKEKLKQIAFPGFDDERDAAGRVKQEKPILVILGNPPYNGYAGIAMDEERDLSTAYRTTKKVAAPQGQGLNDLYVRFFRMAERRIVEKNGQGIVCFISNYSWLDGLSFTGMREHYLDVFDKTGKLTPEGAPDPSIFSTEAYLKELGLGVEALFHHIVAVLHALAYKKENAGALRQDWPRIPLPKAKDSLLASAVLGREVAALLDTEAPVTGVTTGKIRDELKHVAVFQRVDGKPANPEAGDLDLTAGWGHAGKDGVTMPGKGKLIRRDDGACDIFLNDGAYWRNVPQSVWGYTIGGYQVIKKWLSYREKPLLGRGLTSEEVRYVTEIARRLTVLVALQPSLDDNYRNVIRSTYLWMKQ